MGRRPILRRPKPFISKDIWGIDPGFPGVFPLPRVRNLRVTHPFAALHHRSGFSLDLHVLSLPLAFALSQDQTLQFDSVYTL